VRTCPVRRAILDLFNLQRMPLCVRSHQQQTLIGANHPNDLMRVLDLRRTQVLSGLFDKAKRALMYCLEMSHRFSQRRKAATRL
jgi:hypothetical protein